MTGHSILRTVYPIRIMRLLGASTLIVTNAAGGLNPTFNIGDIMFIADHVSFAGLGGANPLIGPNIEALGPRFPATSDAYDFRLRVKAIQAALKSGISQDLWREGIYTFVVGPSFETRAGGILCTFCYIDQSNIRRTNIRGQILERCCWCGLCWNVNGARGRCRATLWHESPWPVLGIFLNSYEIP